MNKRIHTPVAAFENGSQWLATRVALGSLQVARLGVMRTWLMGRSWRARWRGAQLFTAVSVDGVRIAALYLPRQTERPRRLPIIYAHGYCETKEFHLHRAWALAQEGHDVIMFDHRAHGRSGGKYVTFGVMERHDLRAVIDEAKVRGWVRQRVLTMGFSLGGGVVLQHAAQDERVAAVVAMAPFLDFRHAIESFRRLLAPWTSRDWLMAGFERAERQAGFILDDASPRQALALLKVPHLIVVGTADRHLPGTDHSQVLAALKQDGSGRLIQVPGATHLSLVRRFWPGVEEEILGFCGRYDEPM